MIINSSDEITERRIEIKKIMEKVKSLELPYEYDLEINEKSACPVSIVCKYKFFWILPMSDYVATVFDNNDSITLLFDGYVYYKKLKEYLQSSKININVRVRYKEEY